MFTELLVMEFVTCEVTEGMDSAVLGSFVCLLYHRSQLGNLTSDYIFWRGLIAITML